MSRIERLSRRDFLQYTGVSGGGLLLAGLVPASPLAAGVLDEPGGNTLNLFVSLHESGQVDIIAHRSEMGTGIRTSLPQVVADEMGADWDRVKVIQGLANADYGSQNTDGSRSIRNFYHIMRQMGATARHLLERAAAEHWQVSVEECRAENHRVHHSGGKSIGFGTLAVAAARQDLPAPDSLRLKSRDEFRYIGKDLPIVDLHDITTGNTTYGIDVHVPGMLYASIERTPALEGKIRSYKDRLAREVPGVVDVIELQSGPVPTGHQPIEGVAVLARHSWAAQQGRKALDIRWDPGPHADHNSDSYLDALAEKVSTESGDVVRSRGNTNRTLADAPRTVQARYRTPYLAHAPMEPPMATAHLHDGICEVWASTQTPQVTQREVAKALGLEQSGVRVHVTLLGGGFGRKSKPDYSVEAARLARATGKPVQVTWTREDDIRHDYFHSCAAQYFEAALDENGKVTAWLARQAAPPISATFTAGETLVGHGSLSQTFASIPFDVPNISIEQHEAPAHARIGWMRSVYNIPYAFGVGSFVDELAHAAGSDPAQFWLDLIGENRKLDFAPEGFRFSNYGRSLEEYPYDTGRFKGVIRELIRRIPWGEKLPAGEGWGISAARSFLSYVAVASKVRVRDGILEVLEMHCLIDAGTVVNPDRVHAQLEGAMVFGLSLALTGEISFSEGVAEQSNFHDYPIANIRQTPPTIQTHVQPSDALPAGVGEPGVPPVAPSITNAIFAAMGKRIRDLPLRDHYEV